MCGMFVFFFFSSRRRHTRSDRDWSSDVCSSDLYVPDPGDYLKSIWAVGHPDLGPNALQVVARVGDIVVAEAEPLARHRVVRSEERRVGKEGRSRWSPDH